MAVRALVPPWQSQHSTVGSRCGASTLPASFQPLCLCQPSSARMQLARTFKAKVPTNRDARSNGRNTMIHILHVFIDDCSRRHEVPIRDRCRRVSVCGLVSVVDFAGHVDGGLFLFALLLLRRLLASM